MPPRLQSSCMRMINTNSHSLFEKDARALLIQKKPSLFWRNRTVLIECVPVLMECGAFLMEYVALLAG